MLIDKSKILELSEKYGDAFYILDTNQFSKNYDELMTSFKRNYSNFNIAYSYKTNYIPRLCKIVNEKGGYAEIVSSMEYEIAKKCGVDSSKIIFNGPYKTKYYIEKLLLEGGTVHIDSIYELNIIENIAIENPNKIINVAIRCNFDVNDNVISRFGFDIYSEEFKATLSKVQKITNIKLKGMHCHFATRAIETWPNRVKGMLNLISEYKLFDLDYIDLGGGIYGKMADSLKAQFNSYIPSYDEYSDSVAIEFNNYFKDKLKKPELLLEPGSALVGDCMLFASKVIAIKNVRGKAIATLAGSIYNINPTLNKKNPPLQVFNLYEGPLYEDLDFGGFTCIESDYLYKGYNGVLSVGDYVVFRNVGSYSVVLKPPFILPNYPILEIKSNETNIIKRQETFDDLFMTYNF